MSDELKERNTLKLILIVRFACATLDVGHPIYVDVKRRLSGHSFDDADGLLGAVQKIMEGFENLL
jgi:hypothetical protein